MTDTILTKAGIKHRETRFPKPPAGTYAVYMDDVTAGGADGYNCIFTHDITVELYEAAPDPKAEARLEEALDAAGLEWTKQSRYWLPTEQRYQVIYEFTYRTKRRA
jgi:hypothetical protein